MYATFRPLYVCVCARACMHACNHVCMPCFYLYMYVCVCMYTGMRACACAYFYLNMRACACSYFYLYMEVTRLDTNMNTYVIRAYMQECVSCARACVRASTSRIHIGVCARAREHAHAFVQAHRETPPKPRSPHLTPDAERLVSHA